MLSVVDCLWHFWQATSLCELVFHLVTASCMTWQVEQNWGSVFA